MEKKDVQMLVRCLKEGGIFSKFCHDYDRGRQGYIKDGMFIEKRVLFNEYTANIDTQSFFLNCFCWEDTGIANNYSIINQMVYTYYSGRCVMPTITTELSEKFYNSFIKYTSNEKQKNTKRFTGVERF